jgi:SAM-dependent methyltransferase
MKVLDVGCGPGDVALEAAELVGPTGTVMGLDSNPAVLEVARARAHTAGFGNVSFIECDLTRLQLDDTDFDAVVGRLILQHLPEPVSTLRQLVRHLRLGSIVAFQEIDIPPAGASVPPVSLIEQMYEWAKEGLRRAGLETRFGLRLYGIFLAAGLAAPELHCDAFIGAGPDWGWYDVLAETVRSLLPIITSRGVATADEIAIDTLAQRARAAVVNRHSVVVGPSYVSAWTRV